MVKLPGSKVLVVSLLMLGLEQSAWAATRFVATTGSDAANNCLAVGSPCKTITHALTQAAANDTVQVAAGTYNPALGETFPLTITVNLTLSGAGATTTIIDAAGTNKVIFINGAGAAISGVTVTGGLTPGNSPFGGGIFSNSSTTTLTNVEVRGNTANNPGFGAFGGGIDNAGTMTLTNVTVSGNTASALTDATGGGINNIGTLTLTNVTVSGNTASSSDRPFGGGVSNASTMTLTNVTVSGNTASGVTNVLGGGIFNFNFGPPNPSIVTLRNTIVAPNTPTNCSGAITSSGFNLDGDNTCSLTGPGDKPGANPLLGPLALNPPGSTQTHALLLGSPAIDAVTSGCPPPITDQRGVSRAQGPACDMGAYELGVSAPIPTLAEWAQMVLAGLLLFAGLTVLRRRLAHSRSL